MSEGRYVATVEMLIEVQASGVWGEDTTMKQIVDQAARETKAGLLNKLQSLDKPYSATRVLRCAVKAVKVAHE